MGSGSSWPHDFRFFAGFEWTMTGGGGVVCAVETLSRWSKDGVESEGAGEVCRSSIFRKAWDSGLSMVSSRAVEMGSLRGVKAEEEEGLTVSMAKGSPVGCR